MAPLNRSESDCSMESRSLSDVAVEPLSQSVGGPCIDAVLGGEPPAAAGQNPISKEVEVFSGVRVGVDGDKGPAVQGDTHVSISKVQPLGIGIDFQRCVVVCGGLGHCLHVWFEAWPSADDATSGVADDVYMWV